MRNKAIVTMFVGALASGFAMAEATVGDLSQIQGDTIIIRAKANRAAAQQDLDAKARGSLPSYVGGDSEAPVVKAVYGAGKQLYATFLYGSGVVMDAKAGDTILGGFKVISVAVEKVELSKDGTKVQVGYSASAPARAPAAQAPQGVQPTMFAPPPVVRPQ